MENTLTYMCEGKHLCPATIELTIAKAKEHKYRARPVLCPTCNEKFRGLTFNEIDKLDPWPNGCGRNPY